MKSQKTAKQVKQVNVIYTYKFNKINRICFTVLSSNEKEKYNTCFDRDAEHGSCTCRGGDFHNCYHLDQLKARAAEYFAARQPQPEPELTAEDVADLVDPDIEVMQPVKANPVQEAQQFINRVKASKAAKAPAPRLQEDWSTPNGALYREVGNYETVNGRACPMR